MRVWADTDDNGAVNINDAFLAILGFQRNYFTAIPARTLIAFDVFGAEVCQVDQVVNIVDIQAIILAFQGAEYNPDMLAISDDCSVPCP